MRAGVLMGGTLAHQHLTRDELEREYDLYLLQTEEANAIADPLSRIAARRGGVAGAVGNPDVSDLIEALIGAATYASRQLALWTDLRRVRKANRHGLAAGQGEPTDTAQEG